jgi:hypothetical protein
LNAFEQEEVVPVGQELVLADTTHELTPIEAEGTEVLPNSELAVPAEHEAFSDAEDAEFREIEPNSEEVQENEQAPLDVEVKAEEVSNDEVQEPVEDLSLPDTLPDIGEITRRTILGRYDDPTYRPGWVEVPAYREYVSVPERGVLERAINALLELLQEARIRGDQARIEELTQEIAQKKEQLQEVKPGEGGSGGEPPVTGEIAEKSIEPEGDGEHAEGALEGEYIPRGAGGAETEPLAIAHEEQLRLTHNEHPALEHKPDIEVGKNIQPV